ncbi:RES family NAD+ phosphorylase [Bacteriovorax sp. BSW11_IV]|uniref:RES family NAD+ phosphorylase n=1 Tax=Bacteriovorax sp. BSW11_IV TaxID=1353529 RepID=UPI0018CBF094|nr:RES family NAD+ phosphorylase [Bacteriovorax sp. BSW11_IV]
MRDVLKAFSQEKTQQEKTIAKALSEIQSRSKDIESLFETMAEKSKEKLSGASSISIKDSNWVRAVSFDYSKEPLSFTGSLLSDSRFGTRGQPTIYLGESQDVALNEVQFPNYFNATTVFGVNVKLQLVLDLSDTKKLSTNYKIDKTLFHEEWKKFNNIDIKFYTQYLSDVLRVLPIEGFLYESVRSKGNKCLCIFPDKLVKGSSLQIVGNYKEIPEEKMQLLGAI